MLWMGIWGHPYAVIQVQVGVNFRKTGYGRACMMLWCHGWGCQTPLTASHIHVGCIQSVLAPCDAVDGHMGTPYLTAVIRVQVGVNFRKTGYGRACIMLWCHGWGCKPSLTASHIHVGCIQSVLAPCNAVDGHMGTPILIAVIRVQVGVTLEKMGYGWASMMLWCHGWGCQPLLTVSHIYIGCIQSVIAPWDAVDGHMGASLCCDTTCAGGGEFKKNWSMAEPVWCCGVMVEAANPHWLYHTFILVLDIYIGWIKTVIAPWDAVDGHIGASICCNTCVGGGEL